MTTFLSIFCLNLYNFIIIMIKHFMKKIVELNFCLNKLYKQELCDAPRIGFGHRQEMCPWTVYLIGHKDILWSYKSVHIVDNKQSNYKKNKGWLLKSNEAVGYVFFIAQRAVTPKLHNAELRILSNALILIKIYLPTKFLVDTLCSFKVMSWTKFSVKMNQGH